MNKEGNILGTYLVVNQDSLNPPIYWTVLAIWVLVLREHFYGRVVANFLATLSHFPDKIFHDTFTIKLSMILPR